MPDRAQAAQFEPVTVLAFPGEGGARLEGVDHEARLIAALYGATATTHVPASPDDLRAAELAGTLHIAAHGLASAKPWARGIQLVPTGAAGFVSTADLMLRGLYGAELVYLSACSTSVADHRDSVVQSFGGVDYATLASGARTCVATCWDIWDTSAALFAAVLHFALQRGGGCPGPCGS